MGNLREYAKAFVPQQTKNIADLEAVSLDVPMTEEVHKDKEGKDFKIIVANVLGEKYRVPTSVVNDIKAIMSAKPGLKTVKVIKKGQGISTTYTVIPLE